jgi:glycosyltransferase involved in cell wall biosynthesis
MRDAAVMAHAACWHATSHAEADDLRALDRSAHVVEIPNVVPELAAGPADVDRARDAAGIRQGGRYVLYLGRIHPLKRLDRLAEAFLGLRAEFDDLDLVLAGPDESGHRARVAPCFVAAGPRVHWIGAVDDAMKAGLLAGAAVLVLCSDTESFGMSVAEALSVGTPVVVTRTCPWPVVEREGFGAWVDPTPAALADGLRRVLRDPHAARLMGARGRAYARAAFAPGVVAAQWRQVYETLAAGHARPA